MTPTAHRFENLLSIDVLTKWERSTLTDIYDFYKIKKRLSKGQRNLVWKIENQAQVRVDNPPTVDEGMIARIDKVAPAFSNDRFLGGFLTSVKDQLKTGKTLSDRQLQILANAEDDYNKNIKFEGEFSTSEDMQERFSINGSNYALKMRRDLVEQGADLSSKNLEGLVLDAGSKPVISAVKGAKRYTILFFGASRPFIIEERYLKRGKKR